MPKATLKAAAAAVKPGKPKPVKAPGKAATKPTILLNNPGVIKI
jgi:hypothetical protein